MALWGARFKDKSSGVFEAINHSIGFDRRLVEEDIAGSIAHARMLGKKRIIPPADAGKIVSGLRALLKDIQSGKLKITDKFEDIHSFVEHHLTKRIGDAGAKLHTARSRNDQVATDTRLYLKKAILSIQHEIDAVIAALLQAAEKHAATLTMAYTHLQRAQPVTFGHHLMAFVENLSRDHERLSDCLKRVDVSPLGSGACTGTGFPIDRAMTAKELGFASISHNSMDAVASRDYIIEFLACAANLGITMSRIAEDLVLWSSSEFGFIRLADSVSSGSSIMPQKKNPDGAELVRGKSGRLIGNLNTLLVASKGLPLTYNKDLQEDKEAMFDSIDTLHLCLGITAEMFKGMKVETKRMETSALSAGFANATELADYLVKRGIPFREAHTIVGRIVLFCEKNKIEKLEDCGLANMQRFSDVIEADVLKALLPTQALRSRSHLGGTAPARVKQEVKRWKRILKGR